MIAGAVHVSVVFLAGFAFGVLRTVWLSPTVGPLAAVAMELPFILAVSWFACGWCLRKFSIFGLHKRALIGATAFLLLMIVEAALALFLFGTRLEDYIVGMLTPQGVLGLAGQIAFAVIPLFHPGDVATAR